MIGTKAVYIASCSGIEFNNFIKLRIILAFMNAIYSMVLLNQKNSKFQRALNPCAGNANRPKELLAVRAK